MSQGPEQQRYGLIGAKLGHSFSQRYFSERFEEEGIAASYENIELEALPTAWPAVLEKYSGLNVTVPYKEDIIPLVDELHPVAAEIGAVNCILQREGRRFGYNTDAYGFRDSLRPFLKSWHRKALILGTGGASKAVAYVLRGLGIEYRHVSRNPVEGQYHYDELNAKAMEIFPFVINCTPLGMHPDVEAAPALPYAGLTEKNLLYDLIYNPAETRFLAEGRARGTQCINGHHMLLAQAEESWRIWQGGSAQPAV